MNIASPSLQRAERQLEWLAGRSEDIWVLTEASTGGGTHLIADRLAGSGFDVRFPSLADGDRGVIIASSVRLGPRSGDLVEYLPARVEVASPVGGPDIIAAYVPSRDDSHEKSERKRRFLSVLARELESATATSALLIGDLNIVEPDHSPRYPSFRDWEYGFYRYLTASGWVDAYRAATPDGGDHSWVDLENRGYRFDHVFASPNSAASVIGCGYVHDTRESDLTDHSAMVVSVGCGRTEPLDVDRSLAGKEMSLF
jgi:exodeoxyribonuclease-3